MSDTWHVVLRDIMIMLAAGSLITFLRFAIIAIWQLYRLAIEVRDESEPIVTAVLDTAESVRGAARFVTDHSLPPAVTGVGMSAGAVRAYRGLTSFYRGLRSGPPKKEIGP
jgi:hypothetical protein